MKWIWVWFILWNVMFEVKNNWLLTAYSGIFGVSKTSRTLSELWKCDSECLSFVTFLTAVCCSALAHSVFTFNLHQLDLSNTLFQSLPWLHFTFIRQNFELCQLYFVFFGGVACCDDTKESFNVNAADRKVISGKEFDSKYNYCGPKIVRQQ